MFDRFMRVLAADAAKLHGLGGTLVIIDELHAHADDSVYAALRTGVDRRHQGSKLIVISTAGQGADSPLGRLRARALASAEGRPARRLHRRPRPQPAHARMVAPRRRLDRRHQGRQEASTRQRGSPRRDLAEQREAVPELAFRRFHANQWTERAGALAPRRRLASDASARPPSPPASRSGSASTSAATEQPPPSSGSTPATTSASTSTTATPASSTASTRSASSPHAVRRARGRLRPVAVRPGSPGARARTDHRHRVPAVRRRAWCPPPTASTTPSSSKRLTLPDNPELRHADAEHDRPPQPPRLAPRQALARRSRTTRSSRSCMALEAIGEPARTRRAARMALTTRCLGCGPHPDGCYCSPRLRPHNRPRATAGSTSARACAAIAAHPRCEHCGATRDLTADHITPLALDGDPLGPLRVLCRTCNSRRGARVESRLRRWGPPSTASDG